MNDPRIVSEPSLYRGLLGDQLDRLPGSLRRFHDSPRGGKALGTFRVVRSGGRIGGLVADLLGLPKAGDHLPVELEVVAEQGRERWFRRFPGKTLASKQWNRGGLLMESFGLGGFTNELKIEGSRMHHIQRTAYLAGVPLPRALAPYATGYVDGDETGWRVVVKIRVPLLGEIVAYDGRVEP